MGHIRRNLEATEYQFYGSLYQREHIRYLNPSGPGSSFSYQPEMFAQVGLHVDLHDDIFMRLELSSAPSDHVSTRFRAMEDIFGQPGVGFRAYYVEAQYLKYLKTRVGKAPVGYLGDEILFSRSLNLAGVRQWISMTGLGPIARIEVRGGFDLLDVTVSKKSYFSGVQVIGETEFPLLNIVAVFSYFNMVNSEQLEAKIPAAVNLAAYTNAAGADFDILHGHLEVGVPLVPIKVFGDYVQNTASGVGSEESGYAAGLIFGHMAQAGAVAAHYIYLNLERDCVASYLNSELWNTDVSGHEVALGYQILDNLGLSARMLIGNRPAEGDTFEMFTTLQIAF